MATPVNALFHGLPNLQQTRFGVGFGSPGIFVFEYYLVYGQPLHTPMLQIGGSIYGKREYGVLLLIGAVAFFYHKTAANGIVGFGNGMAIAELGHNGEGIGVKGQRFGDQKMDIGFGRKRNGMGTAQ